MEGAKEEMRAVAVKAVVGLEVGLAVVVMAVVGLAMGLAVARAAFEAAARVVVGKATV
jgi:hypothetical protein